MNKETNTMNAQNRKITKESSFSVLKKSVRGYRGDRRKRKAALFFSGTLKQPEEPSNMVKGCDMEGPPCTLPNVGKALKEVNLLLCSANKWAL